MFTRQQNSGCSKSPRFYSVMDANQAKIPGRVDVRGMVPFWQLPCFFSHIDVSVVLTNSITHIIDIKPLDLGTWGFNMAAGVMSLPQQWCLQFVCSKHRLLFSIKWRFYFLGFRANRQEGTLSRAVVLNLWVMTPFRVEPPFHRGHPRPLENTDV